MRKCTFFVKTLQTANQPDCPSYYALKTGHVRLLDLFMTCSVRLLRTLWGSKAQRGLWVPPGTNSGTGGAGVPSGLICLQRLELPQLRDRRGGGATQVRHAIVHECMSDAEAEFVQHLQGKLLHLSCSSSSYYSVSLMLHIPFGRCDCKVQETFTCCISVAF